jgi:hypothetical protein
MPLLFPHKLVLECLSAGTITDQTTRESRRVGALRPIPGPSFKGRWLGGRLATFWYETCIAAARVAGRGGRQRAVKRDLEKSP